MALADRSALLLRPGALGDAVLTLPALHALRTAGIRRITVLGTLPAWAFLRVNSSTGTLRVQDGGAQDWLGLYATGAKLSASARTLLAEIDLALIYLGPGGESVAQALLDLGVREVQVIAPPKGGEPALALPPPRAPNPSATDALQIEACHAARRLLAPITRRLQDEAGSTRKRTALEPAARHAFDPPLAALGPLAQAEDPLLSVTPEEMAAALSRMRLDAPPAAGWLALHPGSGGQRKRWPAGRFAELAAEAAHRFGLVPLLLFGPADEIAQQEIAAAWPRSLPAHRAASLPLREVLALLSLARVFVGNDSGITHLAARCLPTLALFGPTDPRVWQPLGERVTALRATTQTMQGLALKEVMAALEWKLENE